MQGGDFSPADSGAVLLTDEGRKKFLQAWQERKRETITHPYLKEKLAWGLVPYVQALLLARYLRDDLDAYPHIPHRLRSALQPQCSKRAENNGNILQHAQICR